ncbi:MAG: hypothetical protein KDC66_19720, partial [Phaeodactylibacter sp.]|nr:hypothetical protein [Phaeodactylibacter sp.]
MLYVQASNGAHNGCPAKNRAEKTHHHFGFYPRIIIFAIALKKPHEKHAAKQFSSIGSLYTVTWV